jgi:hypothetical protein
MTGMVARIEAVIAPPARQLVTHGHVSSQTRSSAVAVPSHGSATPARSRTTTAVLRVQSDDMADMVENEKYSSIRGVLCSLGLEVLHILNGASMPPHRWFSGLGPSLGRVGAKLTLFIHSCHTGGRLRQLSNGIRGTLNAQGIEEYI